MKKCPYCAEEIQDDAVKCRFCGEFLKKRWWKNCFVGCLIWFVVAIAGIILFIYLNLLLIKFIVYKLFIGPMQHLPPYQYPPFSGGGIEGIFREFGEALRLFWEKFLSIFHIGQQSV